MYYLNAFNEMLRKRQRQNMMGGEGYQGDAPPSGPMGAMGLGPAQDRSSLRDFYNSMTPGARVGLGMIPGIGKAFNVGRLVDAGMSAYGASQLAPSRDARERLQDQFRAFEIADMNAPMQNTPQQSFRGSEIADSRSLNTPQQSFRAGEIADYGPPGPEYGPPPVGTIDPNAYDGAMAAAERMGGTTGYFSAGEPISMAPLVGAPLAPISTDVGSFYGGSDNNANTGNFGGVTGGADTMGFGGTYNQGGMVNAQHLMGRAPAPDDGYGALQGGEYVITKAAVEKYGKRLLDAINNGTFR